MFISPSPFPLPENISTALKCLQVRRERKELMYCPDVVGCEETTGTISSCTPSTSVVVWTPTDANANAPTLGAGGDFGYIYLPGASNPVVTTTMSPPPPTSTPTSTSTSTSTTTSTQEPEPTETVPLCLGLWTAATGGEYAIYSWVFYQPGLFSRPLLSPSLSFPLFQTTLISQAHCILTNYGLNQDSPCNGYFVTDGNIGESSPICDIPEHNTPFDWCEDGDKAGTFVDSGPEFFEDPSCGFQIDLFGKRYTPEQLQPLEDGNPCDATCPPELASVQGIFLWHALPGC